MADAPQDPSSLNSQILDALQQTGATLGASEKDVRRAIAFQMTAHAVGMAMQDAVAQQQRMNTLRNAITAATARLILEADSEHALEAAENAYKLIERMSESADISKTLADLHNLMKDLEKEP